MGILENPTLFFTLQFQANLSSFGSNMAILRKFMMDAKNLRWSSEIQNGYQISARHDLKMFYENLDPNRLITGWDISVQRQSRRLDLATTTFLWPEQRCKILCIFCYFRFSLGQSKVAVTALQSKQKLQLLILFEEIFQILWQISRRLLITS